MAGERDFPIDLDPQAHPRAAEYARAWFARLADGFTDQLEPADQATLAALLAEDGLSRGLSHGAACASAAPVRSPSRAAPREPGAAAGRLPPPPAAGR